MWRTGLWFLQTWEWLILPTTDKESTSWNQFRIFMAEFGQLWSFERDILHIEVKYVRTLRVWLDKTKSTTDENFMHYDVTSVWRTCSNTTSCLDSLQIYLVQFKMRFSFASAIQYYVLYYATDPRSLQQTACRLLFGQHVISFGTSKNQSPELAVAGSRVISKISQ